GKMKLNDILGLKTDDFLERQPRNQNYVDFSSYSSYVVAALSGPTKGKNDKKSQKGTGAGGDKEED
ncbi:hypothetical protein U0070_000456, partial [Myodes glareolus]